MGISSPGDVEIRDNTGSTKAYSGTATTTAANIPATAGNVISGCEIANRGSVDMQVSFDGGATFTTILKKESLSWDVKGNIQQLQIKTAASTTTYDALINFEDY